MKAEPTGVLPTASPAHAPAASAVEAYVRALFDGCAAALATLLSRSVAVDLDLPLHGTSEPLTSLVPAPWLVCEARFTRGVAGAHDLVFPQDDALALARLVLGEDATPGAVLTSDHEDTLREMLNQMLSSASSALKVLLARPTALSMVELRRVESAEDWTARAAALASVRLLVDGVPRARLVLTIPASVRDEVQAIDEATQPARGHEGQGPAGLEMILDITMPITVELGRSRMLIRDILALGPGSVVELDKLAGEPVDLLVNDRPIAKGEVVVIDDSFGVRLTEISHAAERLRSLG